MKHNEEFKAVKKIIVILVVVAFLMLLIAFLTGFVSGYREALGG
ncbi:MULTISPECIES: hypothetical protein [Flavobacterium]|uniref:DUF4044 domain-containing protein n=1 Tax=Flavobacterium jumunjinense TaxID=998845 RepID=A0ABV5GTY3_9FLAO|nr:MULTISPECIES: hypothetical protein [Flavobacterium]